MSRIKNTLRKIRSNFALDRQTLTLLVILSFIGFIAYSSLGGSLTESYNTTGDPSEELGDPTGVNFPGQDGNNYNFSDFNPPSNLNPPAGALPDIGSGGGSFNPPSFNPPDFDPPNSGGGTLPGGPGTGGGSNFPEPTDPGNGGGSGLPNFDPSLPDFGGSDNDKNSSGSPINLPDRPNKAANLLNFSGFVVFPDTSFEFTLDFNFDFLSISLPGFSNSAFLVIILALMYLPSSMVSRLLSTAFPSKKGEEEGEEDEDGIFFKPQKTEAQVRRERRRQKRLQSFSDYLQHIINQIEVKQKDGIKPKDIITWTYLSVDEAFTHFMDLKRDKDLTPLEHAHRNFEAHEINNDALQKIVNLFYLTRFGNKELSTDKVEELKSQLRVMIPMNESLEEDDSRWRIF